MCIRDSPIVQSMLVELGKDKPEYPIDYMIQYLQNLKKKAVAPPVRSAQARLIKHASTVAVKNIDLGSEDEHITCLLYTSPSPRDQRGARKPSSA
eukprot:TRINITY_DN15719_c0_g1_i1.p1 TRINITY_DN15719_c0_g1~~TRINITY_DN15719_c0_g1_i1.p1  ORF type:complete len:105 (+),score=46.92 TRINITY_DN15719_c0_g1_i1:31-315(+)